MAKRLLLNSLGQENFKAIKKFRLDAGGVNVNIYGDNSTGKTTIFDSFTWVLFDKDSQDKKDFQLKPVDGDGREQHHLDHSVTASFLIDGRPLELKKVYREKWTKKRGSATSEFTGHTTDYFLNGVPAKKKEYDQAVSDLVSGNEDLFKLLTSPTYFNEQLNWKQRRKVLLNVCGDLTDEEVIGSKKELAKLPDILGNHSIEDYRKILNAKRKEINKQLETLPIRIDEADKSKPDLSGQSEADLKKQAEQLQKQIEAAGEEINRIRSGGQIDQKKKEKLQIESQQQEMRNNFQAGIHKQIETKRSEYYDLKAQADQDRRMADDLRDQIRLNKSRIKNYDEQLERLRDEWDTICKRKFEFDGSTTCPTCGQDLPADKIEEATEHALKHFKLQKSKELEASADEGKRIRKVHDEMIAENKQLAEKADTAESRAEVMQPDLDALKKMVDELKAGVKSIMDDSSYQETEKQLRALKDEIRNLQASTDDAVLDASGRKQNLKRQLNEVETDLLKFDSVRRIDKRIAELEAQQKRLAGEFEQSEKELYLTEEFIKTKVNLLESRINSKFKMARFKLFDEQINGGLQEVCETTYNGVPYNALNNAAKINTGLDIINTLSEFYGLSAPIFIDNREAVTRLIDVDAEIISLIVSEPDKKLRVEKAEKLEEVI